MRLKQKSKNKPSLKKKPNKRFSLVILISLIYQSICLNTHARCMWVSGGLPACTCTSEYVYALLVEVVHAIGFMTHFKNEQYG